MSEEKVLPGLILCVCTGKCPGFEQMDFWDFINTARIELPVEYAIIHPQICEEDGDRFLEQILASKRPLVIAGCAPNMQKKLFKQSFLDAGMDVETDCIKLDVRDMTTDDAIEKVRAALEEAGYSEDDIH